MIIFLIVWVGFLFYLLGPLLLNSSDVQEQLNRQLLEANGQIQKLTIRNNDLQAVVSQLQGAKIATSSGGPPVKSFELNHDEPSSNYELYRRRTVRDLNEF